MQYAVGIPDPAVTLHESESDHIDDGPALGDGWNSNGDYKLSNLPSSLLAQSGFCVSLILTPSSSSQPHTHK